jgi:transposase-like protein
MTEIATTDMTLEEARRITERIRVVGRTYAEARDKLAALITEAQERRAWEVLGFPSWTEYVAEVFSDEPLRLSRDERREIVGELSEAGMSTRAIAPIVGVSQMQVVRDVQSAPETNVSPAPETAPSEAVAAAHDLGDEPRVEGGRHAPEPSTPVRHIATATGVIVDRHAGEILDERPATLARADKITGRDGKQYERPEPKPRRRAALPPQVESAGWGLARAIDRLTQLSDDDRFGAHKDQMAPQLRSHLQSAIEACQGLLDRINR